MSAQRYQWTLVDAPSTRGRTFRRPLDPIELGFFWSGLINGSEDSMHHVALRRLCGDDNSPGSVDLFSEANIIRAWLSTKRRYPLAGATIVPGGDGNLTNTAKTEGSGSGSSTLQSGLPFDFRAEAWDFIVCEEELDVLHPGEIVSGEVANAEAARQRAVALLQHDSANPRPLSNKLLARLYIFRETGFSGSPSVLHVMTLTTHCILDGMASYTFLRYFIDTLARGGMGDASVLEQGSLEERLMMTIPLMGLEPAHIRALSRATRRWRRAVGQVIYQLRMAKRQGGHTLPCRLTRSTPQTPAVPCRVTTTLTAAQSSAVIANCRLYGTTFGSALTPLAQVAMTRVLFRRYLRGEISEAEWEYRKRQPHIGWGLLDFRKRFDQAWSKQGGGGDFVVSTFLAYYQLPFMTLGGTNRLPNLSDGAPPFEELLSFDRFLHRARLMKKQVERYLKHPLSFEIACEASLALSKDMRHYALEWMESPQVADIHEEVLVAADAPEVWALGLGVSTFGDMDSTFPSEYPLPPNHPLSPYSSVTHSDKAGYTNSSSLSTSASTSDMRSTIMVEYSGLCLHPCPAELYLGAASSGGHLDLFVFYDGNVFENEVIKEWLDEVKGAVLWYLGRMHTKSRQAVRETGGIVGTARAGGRASTGLDRERVSAKL